MKVSQQRQERIIINFGSRQIVVNRYLWGVIIDSKAL